MPETLSLASVFLLQAENNLWSNHRLLTACAALPEAEYFKARPAFFGSIHGTLNHILLVELRYLERMAGRVPEPRQPLDTELHGDLASLGEALRAADRELVAAVEGLENDRLGVTIRVVDRDGHEHFDPLHRVLAHLFVHQVHHRGQVHDMLSQTSVAPPQLDEFYMSQDAPNRAAEMAALGLRERG